MAEGKIYFEANPFEEIIRSAYETLRVECIGTLFGQKYEKKSRLIWIVESAHPTQLAERLADRVSSGCERGDIDILSKNIGGYHSHTMFRKSHITRVSMSSTDVEYLKETPENIEIVIGVKKAKIKRKRKNNPLIKACYISENGSLYKFEVGGYYLDKGLKRAEIIVPKKVLNQFK